MADVLIRLRLLESLFGSTRVLAKRMPSSPPLLPLVFLAPDYAVESVTVRLCLPASVTQAVAAIVDARSAHMARAFPNLSL